MAGREQFRLRLAVDQGLLECDARIAVEHRIAAADQTVALLENAGHAGDLEPARFRSAMRPPSIVKASRKNAPMKCGCRRRACARSICSRIAATEFGSMPSEVSLRSATSFSIACDIDRAIDLSEQLGLRLRPVAVADRIDQEVAQRLALEQFAEHVVDLAAKRLARLLQLLQQAAIDLALARVGGAEVPKVADLGLADAMDAAEPLLQPVRVPGQVVVDHEMRAALKIDALAGGIIGDHDAHDRIAVEGGDGGAAGLTGDAAVDHHDCGRIADACR